MGFPQTFAVIVLASFTKSASAVTLAASLGFILPAGTPPKVVANSSGYITAPRMAKSGLVVDIMARS